MDKFTVLRLALQHIKSLLGSARPAAGAASLYKPSFVSDEEIKQLMKYSNDGFILVADCDRARILFTSQSTEQAVKRESKVCVIIIFVPNIKCLKPYRRFVEQSLSAIPGIKIYKNFWNILGWYFSGFCFQNAEWPAFWIMFPGFADKG